MEMFQIRGVKQQKSETRMGNRGEMIQLKKSSWTNWPQQSMNSREQLGGVLSNLIHSPHRIIVKV